MLYDAGDHPLYGLCLGGNLLIVIPKYHTNLIALQSPDTVGGGEDIVLRHQRTSTLEFALVNDACHPWILIDAGWLAADDTNLLIGVTAV